MILHNVCNHQVIIDPSGNYRFSRLLNRVGLQILDVVEMRTKTMHPDPYEGCIKVRFPTGKHLMVKPENFLLVTRPEDQLAKGRKVIIDPANDHTVTGQLSIDIPPGIFRVVETTHRRAFGTWKGELAVISPTGFEFTADIDCFRVVSKFAIADLHRIPYKTNLIQSP